MGAKASVGRRRGLAVKERAEGCGGGVLVGPRREGRLEGLAERRVYPIAAGPGGAGPGASVESARPTWARMVRTTAGSCTAKGDAARAIPLLEQALRQVSEFGFPYLQGRFATFLGEAHLLNGDLRKARAAVSRGLATSRDARYAYAAEAEAQLGEALPDLHRDRGRVHGGTDPPRPRRPRPGPRRTGTTSPATHMEAYRVFAPLRVPRYKARARELATKLGVYLAADERG